MGFLDDISGVFTEAGLLDQGVGSIGSSLVSDILGGGVAQPVSYGNPYSGPAFSEQGMYPQPVMASGAVAGAGAVALRQVTAPILFKIAQTIGLRSLPSLQRAMEIVRKLSKMLSPAATALALGITMGELATLMTASAKRRRRRMNPTNVRALRRGLRRLQSFEKLAGRVSSQLAHTASRGRRRSVSRGRCNTCRKSPCSC